jgi:acyl-coenzyme A synthetase/AMP-(fatty) acid ligase
VFNTNVDRVAGTKRHETVTIVDTWWQTETVSIMISPLWGVTRSQTGVGDEAAAGHLGQDRRRRRQRTGAGCR